MPNKRRLGVLLTGFTAGGAQRQCALLLNALQLTGRYDIYVLYYLDGPNRRLLSPSIRVEKITTSSLYSADPVRQANRRLREFQPDILFTWLHAADVYGFLLKLMNPRWTWVMTERDSAYPLEIRYLIRRFAGRFADLIVANSAQGARYWRSRFLRQRVAQAPNIVPPSSSARRTVGRIETIAYVGRLEAQKNVEVLCRAFTELARRNAALTFLIVGDGSLHEALAESVRAAGCDKRVRLLGYREDVEEILKSVDLVVSVSHHEGTPNVMLEAVRSGAGIVASRIPEHEAVLGKDYPLLVDDRSDWASVVAQIDAAIAAPSRAQSEVARRQLARMSPESVTLEYENLFDSCLPA